MYHTFTLFTLALFAIAAADEAYVGPEPLAGGRPRRWRVPCSDQYAQGVGAQAGSCTPSTGGNCDLLLTDGFLSEIEVAVLLGIAEKVHMSVKPQWLPTLTVFRGEFVDSGSELACQAAQIREASVFCRRWQQQG